MLVKIHAYIWPLFPRLASPREISLRAHTHRRQSSDAHTEYRTSCTTNASSPLVTRCNADAGSGPPAPQPRPPSPALLNAFRGCGERPMGLGSNTGAVKEVQCAGLAEREKKRMNMWSFPQRKGGFWSPAVRKDNTRRVEAGEHRQIGPCDLMCERRTGGSGSRASWPFFSRWAVCRSRLSGRMADGL